MTMIVVVFSLSWLLLSFLILPLLSRAPSFADSSSALSASNSWKHLCHYVLLEPFLAGNKLCHSDLHILRRDDAILNADIKSFLDVNTSVPFLSKTGHLPHSLDALLDWTLLTGWHSASPLQMLLIDWPLPCAGQLLEIFYREIFGAHILTCMCFICEHLLGQAVP